MNFVIKRRYALLPGEMVLHDVPNVKFMSSKALPSYRLNFWIPLLLRVQLLVTEKRVLFVAYSFGAVIQEFWAWYPDTTPPDDREVLEKAEVGQTKWFGKYLLLVMHNPRRTKYFNWLASARAEIRLYVGNAEILREKIASRLG